MDLIKLIADCIVVLLWLVPLVSIVCWLQDLLALGALILILAFFFFLFFVIPVIFKSSYSLQRSLLFLNFVNVPPGLSQPEKLGMKGTRNFRIRTWDNITLGAWHVLPSSRIGVRSSEFETHLADGDPIVIYMHGNSGNRGALHRRELYTKLQNNKYHVIAFDYRNFGDSDPGDLTEMKVVNDSKSVYEWVKKRSGKSEVFLWGHSLGTGVSSHLLANLENEGERINGLVLESPFTKISDEIRAYPLAKIWSFLPWFDYFFTEAVYDNGFRFESETHLQKVNAPILILHAEDDPVVPFYLGLRLYETIKKSRQNRQSTSPIELVKFSAALKFRHVDIYSAKNLSQIVSNFVNRSIAYFKH